MKYEIIQGARKEVQRRALATLLKSFKNLLYFIIILKIFYILFLIKLHAMVFLEVGENAVVQAAGLMSEVKIFLRWQFFRLVSLLKEYLSITLLFIIKSIASPDVLFSFSFLTVVLAALAQV